MLLGLWVLNSHARAEAADSGVSVEYGVKAGYLFKFGYYVVWPTNSFAHTNSPLVIAVMDKDKGDVAAEIEKVVHGTSVMGHPVEVRKVAADGVVPVDAHILFVTGAAGREPETIRAALNGAPTLLVGETENFAELGGAIGFVRQNENIRLTLCLKHATDNGLKLSSDLSTVAKLVHSKLKPHPK